MTHTDLPMWKDLSGGRQGRAIGVADTSPSSATRYHPSASESASTVSPGMSIASSGAFTLRDLRTSARLPATRTHCAVSP